MAEPKLETLIWQISNPLIIYTLVLELITKWKAKDSLMKHKNLSIFVFFILKVDYLGILLFDIESNLTLGVSVWWSRMCLHLCSQYVILVFMGPKEEPHLLFSFFFYHCTYMDSPNIVVWNTILVIYVFIVKHKYAWIHTHKVFRYLRV